MQKPLERQLGVLADEPDPEFKRPTDGLGALEGENIELIGQAIDREPELGCGGSGHLRSPDERKSPMIEKSTRAVCRPNPNTA